jgi:hypothetical protein
VKHICPTLALLGIAVTCYAQEPVSQDSSGKQAIEKNSRPGASPNRTSSKDWARLLKSYKSIKDDDDKKSFKVGAPVWIDSKGQTVGRKMPGRTSILVPFENERMEITGLNNFDCELNGNCSGGLTWNKFGAVFFTSNDCTGTPYVPNSSLLTRYHGVPVVEGSETFIYISDNRHTVSPAINSAFAGNICFRPQRFDPTSAPAIAVIPASDFGTQPFFIQ